MIYLITEQIIKIVWNTFISLYIYIYMGVGVCIFECIYGVYCIIYTDNYYVNVCAYINEKYPPCSDMS